MALGSNLGDREARLEGAVAGLASEVRIERRSSVYATAPVGIAEQPDFLNAAVTGRTALPPESLLALCHRLEDEAGRRRMVPGGPRTLDLDIVLYGDLVVDTPSLTIPHPRFRERSFVLAPLAEIAGGWVDPVTGRTVEEIWRERREGLPPVRRHAPPGDL